MKRAIGMAAVGLLAVAGVFAAGARAQTGTKQAQVFSSAELQQQIASLEAAARKNGSSGATLGDYGSHRLQLSLRAVNGGAEVHAHFDDVMVVLGGTATLITGGTVIDGKTGPDGETKGSGIRDGVRHTIGKGDVLHIPAGTPHQLLIPPGTMFRAFVVKVRE